MKKTLTFTVCVLLTAQVFSQVKTTAKSSTAHKATTQSAATLSDAKSKMLCKAWVLDSIEQFGVAAAPTAKQKTDGVTFTADGNFFITSDGAAGTGTWKGNASPYINTVVGTDDKKMYKVKGLSDNRLVLEYQTPDLIRITYTYSPKK